MIGIFVAEIMMELGSIWWLVGGERSEIEGDSECVKECTSTNSAPRATGSSKLGPTLVMGSKTQCTEARVIRAMCLKDGSWIERIRVRGIAWSNSYYHDGAQGLWNRMRATIDGGMKGK